MTRISLIAAAWVRPCCVGQSMLATVATHSPRNSRARTGGSLLNPGGGGGGGLTGSAAPPQAVATATNATDTSRRNLTSYGRMPAPVLGAAGVPGTASALR